jgi:hypothetical protein
MRYPLARRTKCWVSVSSSDIVPSWRYLKIGSRQSMPGLGNPVMAAISASSQLPKLALDHLHRVGSLCRCRAVFARRGPWCRCQAVFARRQPWCGYWAIPLKLDGGLEHVMCEHPQRGWITARPESGEGVVCFVVSPEDMMKFESIKLLLQLSNLLLVCHDIGVMTV